MGSERKKVSGDIERKIITGMIVSDEFLRDIIPIWNPSLLEVPFVRTVGDWCREHWEKYQKAPGESVGDIFKSKVRRKKLPPADHGIVEDFLEELSEEFLREGKFNAQYWLDEAEKYLDGQALKMLAEDVEAHISGGDLDEAREKVVSYREVRRPTSHAINPFDNPSLMERAFEEAQEPLFTLPGDLGRFMNPMLVRESLIGIMAPEKRGKTFILTELGIHAARGGCNVAFFAVGDMTETQMLRRIAVRTTGKNYMPQYCGKTLAPVLDCKWNQLNTCKMEERPVDFGILEKKDGKWRRAEYDSDEADGYMPCTHCRKAKPHKWAGAHWWAEKEIKRLTFGHAEAAGKQFMKRHGDRWRLFVYEARELTSSLIQADLEQLSEGGFVPDVVIIDYADNMGPEDPRTQEIRHRQNETWMALSALRKRWHACFITATQTDAASYDVQDITMANFSEDKRKLSHVTAMLAINQTRNEKKEGVCRIGMVVAREMEFHIDRQVKILQCLRSGRAILGSYLS